MTRQRIRLIIDAVTVEGGPVSRPALAQAIETALAERLGEVRAPLRPAARACERADAVAQADRKNPPSETAVARAVAAAAHGVLGP